jgi:ectoine hydroxylase-related dioxygenase (phytanoyl-CoA dioxygenase family)
MEGSLDEWRDLLPSVQDVEFFHEHGWYITPRLYTDDEIEQAIRGVERHHAGERDTKLPAEAYRRTEWKPGDADALRRNNYVALTNADLRAFILKPLLGAVAARLAPATQVRLWHSGIIHKDPGVTKNVTIGWHSDGAYWRTCTSDRMLTVWIPLHDCDESIGTLVVLDGSHRWERTPAVESLLLGRTFLGTEQRELEARLEESGMPVKQVPQVLRRGQVSFHHNMVLHASGPNVSDRPRIAVTVDLQDGDNRYRRLPEDQLERHSHSNDGLCRKQANGDPDYTDPAVFPMLWEE